MASSDAVLDRRGHSPSTHRSLSTSQPSLTSHPGSPFLLLFCSKPAPRLWRHHPQNWTRQQLRREKGNDAPGKDVEMCWEMRQEAVERSDRARHDGSEWSETFGAILSVRPWVCCQLADSATPMLVRIGRTDARYSLVHSDIYSRDPRPPKDSAKGPPRNETLHVTTSDKTSTGGHNYLLMSAKTSSALNPLPFVALRGHSGVGRGDGVGGVERVARPREHQVGRRDSLILLITSSIATQLFCAQIRQSTLYKAGDAYDGRHRWRHG